MGKVAPPFECIADHPSPCAGPTQSRRPHWTAALRLLELLMSCKPGWAYWALLSQGEMLTQGEGHSAVDQRSEAAEVAGWEGPLRLAHRDLQQHDL